MSELDVIKAVLPRLRRDLAATDTRTGGPLYTNRSGPSSLESEAARRKTEKLPALSLYFLLSPGPAPGKPNGFDQAAQFFLDGWGMWEQLDAAFARIAWLEIHEVSREGDSARLRYGRVGGTRPKEPEATMPDGRAMYHYTNTYRCLYVDLSLLSGPAAARAP